MGVYLAASTFKATGDNIFVSAEVQGPPVTSAAVITSPKNGQRFSAYPITVRGSCPPNAAYVEIFRNNLLSGTALCDYSSGFSLSVDLFSGQNDLTAHAFNVTDEEGPVSPMVTVYYNAASPPPGGSTSSAAKPFALTTSFIYKGYYVGQDVQWPLRLTGGTAPYAVNVDWGDGNNSLISRKAEGDFDINHVYSNSGGYKNSYTIRVKATDGDGRKASLQFFVVVNVNKDIGLAGDIYNKPPPAIQDDYHWLWAAWPAYIFILLMGVSYILGEKEQMVMLKKSGLLRRR